MSDYVPPAVRTNGDLYEGVSTYMGAGIRRSCIACGRHKSSAGGKSRKVGTESLFTCCDCIAAKANAEAA